MPSFIHSCLQNLNEAQRILLLFRTTNNSQNASVAQLPAQAWITSVAYTAS